MNYIKEFNAFDNWLETNPLEATTQALWLHLMFICNQTGWLEWFTVANIRLMGRIGVTENTLIKHRNILIQKGRIEYKNQGKRKAGKYRIIPFTSINEVNLQANHEVNLQANHEVNHSALFKLNKTKQKDDEEIINARVNNFVSIFQKRAKQKNMSERLIQETSKLLIDRDIEFSSDVLEKSLNISLDRYLSGKTGPFPEYFIAVLEKEQERRNIADITKENDTEYVKFPRFDWLNGTGVIRD